MTCQYTFPNGDVVRGKPALKAYLTENLATLLPERAAKAGFRRTPVQAAIVQTYPPEQRAMVERMVKGSTSRWANPPKLEFFNTLQDPNIPEAVRAEDARQRAGGAVGDVEGFYLGGTAYIWYGLKTPQDVQRVTFHEGLGHYGLRGVFGKELENVLEQIVALRKKDVLAKAKEYGYDTNDRQQMLQAAEEVLAAMAQTTPNIGFVRRAVAAIRAWLRQNVPGMADLQLSDAEIIRDYILPARAFVERGAKAGKDMVGAGFSRAAPKLKFSDEAVDAYSGQTNHVLTATGADGSTGTLEYTVYRGSPSISMISVPETSRRRGVATGLVKELQRRFPDQQIEWGYMTDEGAALKSALPKRTVNTEFAEKFNELESVRSKLTELSRKADAGTLTEADREGWNDLHDREWDLETELSGQSPTKEIVHFSRSKAPAPTGLTLPEQSKLRKTQAEFQDNNNRIKQYQAKIAEVTGAKVPEYADYYQAETNRPGRIAARLQDFREKMQAPLVERIAKSGHTLAQVEELAHAMHAIERNRAVAKINPKHDPASPEFIGVEGSGMNSDKAADILAKYRNDAALQKHVTDLQKIARATLDMKLAYGRIPQEQYDAYTKAYDFYVPLKGDGEYGPEVKRAMGHEERDEHIVENVMRDYEQAVVTGERNLARQALVQLVLENPDSDLWTIGVTPKGRYVAGQVFTIMKDGQEVAAFTSQAQVDAFMEAKGAQSIGYEVLDEKGEKVREFAKPLQDNEVPVYINGQRVRIQIKDEILAGQLRPMDQQQMGWVLSKFRELNRYLSKIYTGYNPTFLITNPLRDVQTGTINMLGTQGAAMAAKAWAQYPAAIKALAQYAATGNEPNTEMGKMLKEYRMHGGKTGASYMSDLEEQGKTLQRLFDDAYGAKNYMADGKPGKAALIAGRKALLGMAHAVEVMNQATENSLRLSLYVAMRNAGSTPGEAAAAAKNVTVNFDRKGNQTGVMGALYLFFNPAVQGTANALRTLAKGEHKKQAWVALGALAALGMYAASQGMEDDEDRWLGENWEIRSKKLVLNIGGTKITVPLSLEFAPFYAFGVALEEGRSGKVKPIDAAGRMISSFIDAYVPFKGLYSYDSDNKPLDSATSMVPTVLRPAVEAATNRNAFGSKIVPESDFNKDQPDNLKMNRNTKGTAYDAAAQGIAAVGELAGAGRYENDITKVSPEMLKHWWRTYTGGLGSFLGDAASLAKLAAEDAGAVELADVPVAKAFAKGQDVSPIRGRYYDLTKDARAAAEEFKQAKKAGDGEAIDKIMQRPDKAELLGFDRLIKTTNKAVAAIRDEMVDVNADKSLSLGEKRAKLKALEKEEEAIYRGAIAAFR